MIINNKFNNNNNKYLLNFMFSGLSLLSLLYIYLYQNYIIIIPTILILSCCISIKLNKPIIYASENMNNIISKLNTVNINMSIPLLLYSSTLQILICLIHTKLSEKYCKYTFITEYIPVNINKYVYYIDYVVLKWLDIDTHYNNKLNSNSPIVIFLPGLVNNENNLPYNNIYDKLIKNGYRVVVYLKRGMSCKLISPIVDIFGHPEDLYKTVNIIKSRYPGAPIHIISFSGGNGLNASLTNYIYNKNENENFIKSQLLLCGAKDYNHIYTVNKNFISDIVYNNSLKKGIIDKLIKPNKYVLTKYNINAYNKLLNSKTFQELQDYISLYFSGYDKDDYDNIVNPCNNDNFYACKNALNPTLVVYTADDPINPEGIKYDWANNSKNSKYNASIVFPHGSHLACYNSLKLDRWIDDLIIEWLIINKN